MYVAWGIVKLNGRILFHQREAKEHQSEYGLIGGRTNLSDLKKVLGENSPRSELLRILQTRQSEHMLASLEYTLQRECQEEIQLSAEHFEYKP